MIDFTLEEIMELARLSEQQRNLLSQKRETAEPKPVSLPEDLRGKLRENLTEPTDDGESAGPAS